VPALKEASRRLELHLSVTEAIPALERLRAEAPLSGQRLKDAMLKGAVWLTRGRRTVRLRRVKRILSPGDRLHLYFDPAVLGTEPPCPDLVFDGGAYSVWNKPFGMLSQGSKWGDHCTLRRSAERRLRPERPAFVVHRLDRAATGLTVLAHSRRSAAALSEAFRARRVEKRYATIVHGRVSLDRLPFRVDSPIDGREARTTLLEAAPWGGERTRLVIDIETGRKHQIRRHVASLGHPIVGDRLYGVGGEGEDLRLCATVLSFACPVSGEVRTFRIAPPFGERPSGAGPR